MRVGFAEETVGTSTGRGLVAARPGFRVASPMAWALLVSHLVQWVRQGAGASVPGLQVPVSPLTCPPCLSRLSSLSSGDSAPDRTRPSPQRQPLDAPETAGKLRGPHAGTACTRACDVPRSVLVSGAGSSLRPVHARKLRRMTQRPAQGALAGDGLSAQARWEPAPELLGQQSHPAPRTPGPTRARPHARSPHTCPAPCAPPSAHADPASQPPFSFCLCAQTYL